MGESVSTVSEKPLESKTPGPVEALATGPDPALDWPVTVIERGRGWQLVNLRELWRYRELLYFLTWRDVKVRYKQTVLGATWAILQPLATMLVFALFLGRVSGIASTEVPYPLFVFAGLIPWTFFANAITAAGTSVVGNQNLVTKVYFPRLIIPVSATGAGLVDFAIAFGMLLLLMLWYGVLPGMTVVLLPLIFLGLVLATLGVGTLLAALTVAYRDVRYLLPFLVQLWMFATPTIYMDVDTFIGERGRWLLPLNPTSGLISNFRQAMLGGPPDWYALAVSGGVSVLLLLVGCFYFRRVERSFADVI
jgi:lipopolysaccharide transport system permease protein